MKAFSLAAPLIAMALLAGVSLGSPSQSAPSRATTLATSSASSSANPSAPSSATPSASQPRFPPVEAVNLNKRPMKLPQDFAGARNLVLIAFQRQQQKDVDTWLHEMKQFEAIDSALHYYELPTMPAFNPVTRWFIDNGIRSGFPLQPERDRIITLYVDKVRFRAALGVPDESRIYVLLLDRQGNVVWRTEGTFDESKANSLKRALLHLNPPR